MYSTIKASANYGSKVHLLFYLYYMCNYHYDENYTMGPNSTSLFILTLRKLQTIRQQGNTYLLLPSILGPPLPSTGARVMTKVMRNEVCLKNLRKA